MTLPPYAATLGAILEAGDDGAPVLMMNFTDEVVGRPGFLHGGAIAGLMELAAIVSLGRALEEQRAADGEATDGVGAAWSRIKPITVTVDFMRGGRDKPTRAAGVVTRLGGRIANVEATAWQDDRARPIAAARMNYLIARD